MTLKKIVETSVLSLFFQKKRRKQLKKKNKSNKSVAFPSLSEFSEIIDQEINRRQIDLVDLSRENQKIAKKEKNIQRRKCLPSIY